MLLKEDVVMKSPSTAATIVCGKNLNGWVVWKNKDGEIVDIYRKNKKD